MRLSRTPRQVLSVLVAVLVLGLWWWSQQGETDRSTSPDRSTPSATSDPAYPPGDVDPASGLPLVDVDELPGEAAETLALIDAGGPFPYPRNDGVVFENREDLLPDEDDGYYHEYTVPTPGAEDRGPRRVVTGDEGEYYWTEDHYDSFERIVR